MIAQRYYRDLKYTATLCSGLFLSAYRRKLNLPSVRSGLLQNDQHFVVRFHASPYFPSISFLTTRLRTYFTFLEVVDIRVCFRVSTTRRRRCCRVFIALHHVPIFGALVLPPNLHSVFVPI
jgi:hypothetical protein